MNFTELNKEKISILNKKYVTKDFSNEDERQLTALFSKQEQLFCKSRKAKMDMMKSEVKDAIAAANSIIKDSG